MKLQPNMTIGKLENRWEVSAWWFEVFSVSFGENHNLLSFFFEDVLYFSDILKRFGLQSWVIHFTFGSSYFVLDSVAVSHLWWLAPSTAHAKEIMLYHQNDTDPWVEISFGPEVFEWIQQVCGLIRWSQIIICSHCGWNDEPRSRVIGYRVATRSPQDFFHPLGRTPHFLSTYHVCRQDYWGWWPIKQGCLLSSGLNIQGPA